MRLTFIFLILITVGFLIYYFYFWHMKQENVFTTNSNLSTGNNSQLSLKKVVFLVAWRGFRDEEYFITKKVLEKYGVQIYTASLEKGEAIGAKGGKTKIDFLQDEIDPLDYDAVIFIGGPKALDYLDNENSYRIIRETVESNKLLAAICISPVILAKAGVLQGKRATVWSAPLYRQSIDALKKGGAIYLNQKVVVDGNIITANGPSAAEEFGKEIIKKLEE